MKKKEILMRYTWLSGYIALMTCLLRAYLHFIALRDNIFVTDWLSMAYSGGENYLAAECGSRE